MLVWALVGLAAGALINQVVPGRTATGTVGALAAGLLGGLLGGAALAALGANADRNWVGALAVGAARPPRSSPGCGRATGGPDPSVWGSGVVRPGTVVAAVLARHGTGA